jgi:hypothetical protein
MIPLTSLQRVHIGDKSRKDRSGTQELTLFFHSCLLDFDGPTLYSFA